MQHAISKGALIDLATDYRTSRTLRAWLPPTAAGAFAISAAAYHEQVTAAAADLRQSRLEAICVLLSRVSASADQPAAPDQRGTSRPVRELPGSPPLKVEWYAPGNYWVVLLPGEQLQPLGA